MRCFLYGVVLFLSIFNISCVSRVNLTEGIASFKTQDYRRAFVKLKPEAEKGQIDAQYAIGYMYYYGQGVTEDRIKALYWISRAASAGQSDALIAFDILSPPSNKAFS